MVGLTARIACPRAESVLKPLKSAPISGLPCDERWRMQIARLLSAGVTPLARAEMEVRPANMRGDEEKCRATRVCAIISRRSEPRAT